MSSIADLSFWQIVIPPICVLSIPIALITKASILRSLGAGTVIYIIIFIAELVKI